MEKKGARNSKADADRIQNMHDHTVALGASCKSEKAAGTDDDLVKAIADRHEAQENIVKLETERDDLLKQVADLTTERDETLAELQKIKENTPQPRRGQFMSIAKSEDGSQDVKTEQEQELDDIGKIDDPQQRAVAMIKFTHKYGRIVPSR